MTDFRSVIVPIFQLPIFFSELHAVFQVFFYHNIVNHQLHIDNHTLVEECKKGDKEALNLFYLRYAPRMLSVIRRYVNDGKDAEDILHDGFIVAFTRLNSLRDADKVDYWLATIMKNLSLQFLQAQDVAEMLHEVPDVEDTPQIDEIIDLPTLESLIKKLPPGYQKVFRLAVLENKTHKEIAKLLGIAPNSSSSQLFHAKLMMRKLITDYKKQTGMLCLLLLGVTAGMVYWRHNNVSNPLQEAIITSNDRHSLRNTHASEAIVSESNSASAAIPGTNNKPGLVIGSKTKNVSVLSSPTLLRNDSSVVYDKSLAKENDSTAIEKGVENPYKSLLAETTLERTDSVDKVKEEVPEIEKQVVSNYYAYSNYGRIKRERSVSRSSSSDWSIRVSADAGIISFNSIANDDYAAEERPGGNWSTPGVPPDDPPLTNPDISEGDKDNRKTKSVIGHSALAQKRVKGFDSYKDVSHVNYLPISMEVAISKSFNKILSLESGLTYTYLHSQFESFTTQSHCHWHYLGIPIKLNINTVSFNKVNIYLGFGGALNVPLYSKADVKCTSGTPRLQNGRFSSPVVWSLSASYGLSVRLSDKVDVFIEPTLQYQFEHKYNIPNVWSDNDWGFSLPIGFRFNL